MFDTAPDTTLTEQQTPSVLFSVKGAHVGPRLVVTGAPGALSAVAEKLWELRDLIAMRGTLELRAGPARNLEGYADAVLHLEKTRTAGHLRVLGRMTTLGMISGRGVPVRFIS